MLNWLEVSWQGRMRRRFSRRIDLTEAFCRNDMLKVLVLNVMFILDVILVMDVVDNNRTQMYSVISLRSISSESF